LAVLAVLANCLLFLMRRVDELTYSADNGA
jgi:hypothetical protein